MLLALLLKVLVLVAVPRSELLMGRAQTLIAILVVLSDLLLLLSMLVTASALTVGMAVMRLALLMPLLLVLESVSLLLRCREALALRSG